jgi:hypothetical protein
MIMKHGLLSKEVLEQRKIRYVDNDKYRFDSSLDAVCLSISHPNNKMFYKLRKHLECDWVVLEIRPDILWTHNCTFYPTNAASSEMTDLDDDDVCGLAGLEALFVKENRRDALREQEPTDVQAEVLVFDPIPLSMIRSVVFPSEDCLRKYASVVPNGLSRVDASLFSYRDGDYKG